MSKSILEEASEIVTGERAKAYGDMRKNWDETAALWSVILGIPVTARQAVLCLIGVKLAREAHLPKRDNRVDLAGYAEVLDKCTDQETPP